MFKNIISMTPLTTDDANTYFDDKIYGSDFMGDRSFIATLRALMAPRLPENKSIRLYHGISTMSASKASEMSKREIVDNILYNFYEYGSADTIYIHNVSGSEDGNRICMDAIAEEFEHVTEGFHRLPDVTNLYRKTFEVICFVNPETRQTAIFVNAMNMRKYHYLQCSILGILPWYFDPSLGITELETALIYSLREKTSEKYEDCIAKIAELYDFNAARIKKLLKGFETRYERKEIETARKQIERANININNLNAQIGEQLRTLRDYNIRLLGLQAKMGEDTETTEMMDYFLCNRRLYLESVGSDDSMVFDVKDYLTYFDEDLVKSCLNNRNSYVYSYCHENYGNRPVKMDQMKKLITAIFLDQTIKMRFCSSYRFLMAGEVRGLESHSYPSEFRTYMPNPHIDRYHCMGNYSTSVNRLLRENKYIEAIEQCVASCKSLNWADGAVMSVFFDRITNNTAAAVYELPDGRNVTIMDAINWIESQEKSNEQTEEA